MRKISEYLSVSDECVILCFDISGFYEIMNDINRNLDENALLDVCGYYHELFRSVARKMRDGGDCTNIETIFANRMGDGAYILFTGDDQGNNLKAAFEYAGALRACYVGKAPDERTGVPPESSERKIMELLKIAVHVGKVYRYEAELIFFPPDEAKYNYVSLDMNLCAAAMKYGYPRHYDVVLSARAWEMSQILMKDKAENPPSHCHKLSRGGGEDVFMFGVDFDDVDWDEVNRE